MSSRSSSGAKWTQFVTNKLTIDGSIDVSIEANVIGNPPGGHDVTYISWTMRLQRLVGATWTDIGVRTGYCDLGSPSHRTFTNVKNTGGMRIKTECANAYIGEFLLIDTIR